MNETYKNVLITGGAGRLGRYLLEEFKNEGYTVTLFDQKAPAEQPFPWELPRGTMFVRGQLTDLADMMRAITLSRATLVVHVAAITHTTDMQPTRPFPQALPEDTTMKVNVLGTYVVLDACRRLGVKNIIFASSYYALGVGGLINRAKPFEVKYLPIDEKHPLFNQDTYGLSKQLGEMMLEAYSRAYGFKCVAFRLMGVSYPGIRPIGTDDKIPESPRSEWKGGPVGTTYQYSDCRDIAYAMRLAADKDLENDYECFFHSSDTTFRGPTAPAIKLLYPDLADMADAIEGEDGLCSTKKLKSLLGYESKYSWKKDL